MIGFIWNKILQLEQMKIMRKDVVLFTHSQWAPFELFYKVLKSIDVSNTHTHIGM